jgi:hypothetical protein
MIFWCWHILGPKFFSCRVRRRGSGAIECYKTDQRHALQRSGTLMVPGIVGQRLQFLSSYQKEEMSVSDLCREFGVSQQTGYRWINRYAAVGNTSKLGDHDRCSSSARHNYRCGPPSKLRPVCSFYDAVFPSTGRNSPGRLASRTGAHS